MKNIEVEIRGEVAYPELPRIKKMLQQFGFRRISSTRRTSVMSFGETSAKGRGWNLHKKEVIDVRCRVTNGEAEVVMKVGQTDAANRLEISQDVSLDQMITFAKIFASTGLFTKVGSKFTKNYRKGNVIVSLVQSPSRLAYVELEKMSTRKREKKDLEELYGLAGQLGVRIFSTPKEFLELCDRLTKRDDWKFHGTARDIQRLKKEIRRIGSDKKS